ncbi:MAG: gephyrin-like molybdotransferase Glp [Desulfurococcaceae archaeon]
MPRPLDVFVRVDEARSLLAKALSGLVRQEAEEVELLEALGGISAEDVAALRDSPPFDRSAVDGYAVRSSDVSSASRSSPALLRIREGGGCLGEGEAVPVSTGDPLPCGADAVLMLEDCERRDGQLLAWRPAGPGANVSRRGEDFAAGEVVVRRGQMITAYHVAAIAAAGRSTVKVLRRLRVGVVAVGSELVEPGAEFGPHSVFNSTAYLVVALLNASGIARANYHGIVPDDPGLVAKAIEVAADANDLVVTTGGTGPSSRDVVLEAIERLAGANTIFRGVAMRPGRPTSATSLGNGKVVVHLSGFPVAAWTGSVAILLPALFESLGLEHRPRTVRARLARRLPGSPGYRTFVRVKLVNAADGLEAEPIMLRGSGVLSSLFRSDGYVIIPEDVEGFERGTLVDVHMLF